MPDFFSITPIAASSLLDLETPVESDSLIASTCSFRTGVHSLDTELSTSISGAGLWSAGSLIAVGDVSGGVGGNGETIDMASSMSLPLEIIATHLTETNAARLHLPSTTVSPSVFIITPPPQLSSIMQRLYTLLTQRIRRHRHPRTYDQTRLVSAATATSALKADDASQAEALLERVSVLQFLDMPGLLASISEVNDATNPPKQQQQQQQQGTVVLLLGLSATLRSTQARYGLTRSAALLCGVLQALRELCRSAGRPLVLVELEIAYVQNTKGAESSGGSTSTSTSSGGLQTAFAGASKVAGSAMCVCPVGALGRLMERAMDVVVGVHSAQGKIDSRLERRRVVEVLHDGVGGCFGRWAVWGG